MKKKVRYSFSQKNNGRRNWNYSKKNNFRYIEWVATSENLIKNPVFINKQLSQVKKNCKKNKVKIRSIDAQFFIKEPFFKGNRRSMKKNFNKLKRLLINAQKN